MANFYVGYVIGRIVSFGQMMDPKFPSLQLQSATYLDKMVEITSQTKVLYCTFDKV